MKTLFVLSALPLAAAIAGCAGAASKTSPAVPADLDPSAGEVVALKTSAAGTQIYQCGTSATGAPQWVFVAPEADLYDERGGVIGKHYAGPTWELPDGSKVKGEVQRRVDATAPGAIPWLLLRATSTGGPGKLAGITSIQRIHTRGGGAPQSGCSAQAQGQQVRAYYSADYVFYARR